MRDRRPPTVVWHSTDCDIYHTDSECPWQGPTAEPKETSKFPVDHLRECKMCSGDHVPQIHAGGGISKLERILREQEDADDS